MDNIQEVNNCLIALLNKYHREGKGQMMCDIRMKIDLKLKKL
jgi:hypothetical protein